MSEQKFATLAVHAGQEPDPLTGAVNVPVYLSSTFELTGIGTDKGWDYSRAGNPTRDRVETGACGTRRRPQRPRLLQRHGCHLRAGRTRCMPATTFICSHNVYGGTARLFNLIVATTASRFSTST